MVSHMLPDSGSVCLTNKCKNSYGGKAVTGEEEKIRESQREEITIELGLEGQVGL